MKNNNDKKKILIIVLLLVAMIGVVGYGAYSYYYTQGEFEQEDATSESDDNVITITGVFNPEYYISPTSGQSDSGSNFLGRGGTLNLSCPETTGGHERIECTASVEIRNQGSTGIYVDYHDAYASASSSDTDVYAESPSFSWSDDSYSEYGHYISNGSSITLYVSVYVDVGENDYISSGDAQFVDAPVSSGSLDASVSFRISATQSH